MNKFLQIVIVFLSYILPILLVIGFITFEIVLWVQYGSKPIDEIPFWVLWFLWGK